MSWIEGIALALIGAAIVNVLVNGSNTAAVIGAGGDATSNILKAVTAH